METLNYKIDLTDIDKLGQVECAASCFLTLLKMVNKPKKYFLSNYWSLNYHKGLLMGSKPLRRCNLDYIYGCRVYLRSDNIEGIKETLDKNHNVLYICKASELSYFPEELLILDAIGVVHVIIINGYDDKKGVFQIIDPIVDHIGEIKYSDLEKKTNDGQFLNYLCVGHLEESYKLPDNTALFKFISGQNYFNFMYEDHILGVKSFDQFSEELDKSLDLEKLQRDQWLYNNSVTIVSLTKIRTIIWENIKSLDVLSNSQIGSLYSIFIEIEKLWNTFSFYISKFQLRSNQVMLKSLQDKIIELKNTEILFLDEMKKIGFSL